ncbi:acyltransferase family protein [Biformimicrobium ophioploci]|uniref:Acyltransferase family protein n=1 Tax=Biformimicrobium ophioploci TaxID=3036711 RepID=A0ABQ6LVA2_9GAMM|nr:acyltransferase family protein [Microbulbifer sp. NKW57]GMG85986.1 acyltransferase family protein [Microbulbifer sp. NKW57]
MNQSHAPALPPIGTENAPARRYDLDWLRILAFALLILYHLGMLYVADWEFHLKSSHLSEPLKWLMLFSSEWRLPLLFFVSGIASRLALRRVPLGRFTGLRSLRLLLPLLLCSYLVVSPQLFFQLKADHGYPHGFGTFLWQYLQPLHPELTRGVFNGLINPTWNHLWFLAYLWAYSMALVALLPLLGWLTRSRVGRAVRELLNRPLSLVLLPALPLALGFLLLSEHFATTRALVDDWNMHSLYFTVFLYGYWLGDAERPWASIRRRRRSLLLLGMAGYALVSAHYLAGMALPRVIEALVVHLNIWLWLLALSGYAAKYLNFDHPLRRYCNRAILPWYILHQTLMIAAAYWLVRQGLGPVLEAVVIGVITVAGCWAGYAVIRRYRPLRLVFGLPLAERERVAGQDDGPLEAAAGGMQS